VAFEEMLVAIIAVVFGGSIILSLIKSRERVAIARENKQNVGSGEGYKELEERIRVLERIVTDKTERLKTEIDAL